MPDADATVSLGDVKHQGGQGLVSRAKWKALADVGQGGVRGLIREVSIRGDAADGTIHNKTGRTIRRDHYAQFAHGSAAIAAPELLVPAGDRTDPPLTEFSRQPGLRDQARTSGRSRNAAAERRSRQAGQAEREPCMAG